MLTPILHLRDGIILQWKAYNLQPIIFLQGNIVQINLKLDKLLKFNYPLIANLNDVGASIQIRYIIKVN